MNKKIYVFSKQRFDNLMVQNRITDENIVDKDIAIISIHSKFDLDSTENPYFEKDTNNVLNLFFEDIENDTEEYKSFSIEQGNQVLGFIENNKDKSTFIIHCLAGRSRSGAIGQFICDYFNCDKDDFKLNNPQINPNQKVLQILNNLRYERI